MIYRIFQIVSLALLFGGCSPESLDRHAYVSSITDPENGLIKRQEFGDMAVEVFYQPLEFVYLKERKEKPISVADFNTWKKEREGYEYYVVRLVNRNVKEIAEYKSSGFNEYASKLDYLVAGFQDDINMVCGTDTVPCALFHYERSYGLSGNNNFNVIFKRDTTSDKKTMMIDLSVFDLGRLKFTFNKNEIRDIPKLSI